MNSHIPGPNNLVRLPFQIGMPPVQIGDLPAKIFQEAVTEFATGRQCPPEFGYIGALAAMSIAMQNLYDVETPDGHRFPPSMFLVGVGGATSGKSSAGDYFLKCIEDFEVSNYHRLPGAGFLYKNTTGAALYAGLDDLPTAGLISCEGSEILNTIVRSEAPNLNSLWSGEPIRFRRVDKKRNFVLRNARLTIMALVHPGRLQKFLSQFGERLKDEGLLARLMVVNAGDPCFPAPRERTPEPCRDAFSNRISELLEQNVEAACGSEFKRRVMRFDPNASRIWLSYAAQLRLDGRLGGRYELAPEHARRLAENVARVAALLHYFEGLEGDIGENSLYSAIALCGAASQHFMNLFVPEVSEELDAKLLDDWLTHYRRQRMPTPQRFIPRAELRRCAPNRMRDNAILNPLIEILISRHRVAPIKKNGTWYLDLMPWDGSCPPPIQTAQAQTSV